MLEDEYALKVEIEGRRWGDHLKVEDSGDWNAWIDHPLVAAHYNTRGLIDGLAWADWVRKQFGGPATRSLDLGCGAGNRSIAVFLAGASSFIEGIDVSEERVARATQVAQNLGINGQFTIGDANNQALPPNRFDLIFSCHSFHHFLNLEHIMEQVHNALTPRGFFILEEYVGPTQLQWTDHQIALVRSCLSLMPTRLRTYRSGVLKAEEARPTTEQVVAVSPFESIRSSEIFPLFSRYFKLVAVKRLGGTIQHLLYNGIIHNFLPGDAEAMRSMESIFSLEDALIDGELLPSDFMILVGTRRDSPPLRRADPAEIAAVLRARIADLEREARNLLSRVASYEQAILELRAQVEEKNQTINSVTGQLRARENEIDRMKNTLGGRLLGLFGPIKYRYVLPLLRALGVAPRDSAPRKR
ncbi:MAG TPA: class I SAM-dependent methyltransferase [Blastocatellia bacterium]|nr:class I SAM-dependent methyltransferase [Blastocatellia bacterium]